MKVGAVLKRGTEQQRCGLAGKTVAKPDAKECNLDGRNNRGGPFCVLLRFALPPGCGSFSSHFSPQTHTSVRLELPGHLLFHFLSLAQPWCIRQTSIFLSAISFSYHFARISFPTTNGLRFTISATVSERIWAAVGNGPRVGFLRRSPLPAGVTSKQTIRIAPAWKVFLHTFPSRLRAKCRPGRKTGRIPRCSCLPGGVTVGDPGWRLVRSLSKIEHSRKTGFVKMVQRENFCCTSFV